MNTFYKPDLLYLNGEFVAGQGLLVDGLGRIVSITRESDPAVTHVVDLPRRAMLPAFVNAHSHSFQRLIRGKAESRAASGNDFWSWRGTMYHAASSLDPGEIFDVARMAFLEMALSGIGTVGEFHYLHNDPFGIAYEDPNLLSKQVIAAAQSVGIRIVLLRTAYFRAGFDLPPDPGQRRFYEKASAYLINMEALVEGYDGGSDLVRFGIAPHSIRAVPLDDLVPLFEWARGRRLPIQMHVAEQTAENAACMREYGTSPVALLHRAGLLGADLSAVHSIHVTSQEFDLLAAAGTTICSCPTTERNLGDGILAADEVMRRGIPIALGSDSQAQIDPLEDARELEYHLRLRDQKRALLDGAGKRPAASELLECATIHGARALAVPNGELTPGRLADFFTIDRNDVSIAGHSEADLLSILLFSLNRTAIRDLLVNGKFVVRDGAHPLQQEIVSRYAEVHAKTWAKREAAPR